MRRMLFVLVASLLLGASLTAAGQGRRVTYSVDASTANPSATVVQNGKGVVVVIFSVPSLDAGGTFTFRADLGVRGRKVQFPVVADMEAGGQRGLTAAFDPVEVSFPDGDTVVSTDVTVTLEPGTYTRHKVKMMIKARPHGGHGLGRGPGIKVVIVERASAASRSSEEQMLQDVVKALAPEAEEP
jgi:hypothetical protein